MRMSVCFPAGGVCGVRCRILSRWSRRRSPGGGRSRRGAGGSEKVRVSDSGSLLGLVVNVLC